MLLRLVIRIKRCGGGGTQVKEKNEGSKIVNFDCLQTFSEG
jgi:hypothetical protein